MQKLVNRAYSMNINILGCSNPISTVRAFILYVPQHVSSRSFCQFLGLPSKIRQGTYPATAVVRHWPLDGLWEFPDRANILPTRGFGSRRETKGDPN